MKTRAPLRISFAGGGTDIEPYCSEYGGCVLSVAIKVYAYATFPSKGATEIERTISCYFKSDPVKITSSVPKMSGLGGSASCFVAGIKAVKPELKKRRIAELAFELERNVMKVTGGKQDQYMSAYGGLSFIEFGKDVKITQMQIPRGFSDLLLLVYMGKRNKAGGDIIKDQMRRMNTNAFDKQKRIAIAMKDKLELKMFRDFGDLLNEAWLSKLEFSPLIATEEIKDFYDNCKRWGAIGGKLTGAGGGGYMLLMEDPEKPNELRLNLWAKRFKFDKVQFEGKGVTMIHRCDKCNSAMLRSGTYDPDGLIPLHGGEKEYANGQLKEWWVCISGGCVDGKHNSQR